jgi:hypothetical protein
MVMALMSNLQACASWLERLLCCKAHAGFHGRARYLREPLMLLAPPAAAASRRNDARAAFVGPAPTVPLLRAARAQHSSNPAWPTLWRLKCALKAVVLDAKQTMPKVLAGSRQPTRQKRHEIRQFPFKSMR